MASQQSTVDFIVEQMVGAGSISSRKMFGEFAIYCDGKVVALVCNDKLFVKPTPAGQAFAGSLEQAPAYKGAKPSLLVTADLWDDTDWLSQLIRTTADALPPPRPKVPPRKRPPGWPR